MTHYLRCFHDFFTKLSDAKKMAIGFSTIMLFASLGIGIFCETTLAQLSNHDPSHTPTFGELYAAELLRDQAETYPDEAIYVMDDPGQPARYFLLRSYVEDPTTSTTVLRYTDETEQ